MSILKTLFIIILVLCCITFTLYILSKFIGFFKILFQPFIDIFNFFFGGIGKFFKKIFNFGKSFSDAINGINKWLTVKPPGEKFTNIECTKKDPGSTLVSKRHLAHER
jgi:hypothetical protein